ncbi:MAG: hypothetical protein EA415_11210 [Sphaerobacteraceae bacterium]|nr:MAG: hypothetical protein EA415_11210 [Sphaerobacteraceae bacterium]
MDERALDPEDVVAFRIAADDVVGLSRRGIEDARQAFPELIAAMEGHGPVPSFSFQAPDYTGQTGAEEVEPGHWQVTGFDGGVEDRHLAVFAHMVRVYAWPDDDRFERQLTILNEPGGIDLGDISTQDLWDALFMNVRVSRFGDGPLENQSNGMTYVSNEVLRRVTSAIERGARIDLTVD